MAHRGREKRLAAKTAMIMNGGPAPAAAAGKDTIKRAPAVPKSKAPAVPAAGKDTIKRAPAVPKSKAPAVPAAGKDTIKRAPALPKSKAPAAAAKAAPAPVAKATAKKVTK